MTARATTSFIGAIREHVAKRRRQAQHSPKPIIWADDLPKTRSGKIMRRLLFFAEGRELGDVSDAARPDVMSQLQGKISKRQDDDESA